MNEGGEESLVYFKDRYSEGVIGETMGRPWRSGGGEASGKADEEKGGEKQGPGRLEEQDVYVVVSFLLSKRSKTSLSLSFAERS